MQHVSKFKKLTAKTLIAAVDFSKGKHSGYFTTYTGEETTPFEFSNTLKGFEKFWNRLQKFKRKYELEDVVVSFESTGSYGLPFIHYIENKRVRMLQVNPKHTKRAKEITDNSPNKTDKKDPKTIANLILFKNGLTVNIPKGQISELRNLVNYRETLLVEQNKLNNQLESTLAIYFPELLTFFKSLLTKTGLYVLKHYPTPYDIQKADPDKLHRELKKVSKGRVAEGRTNKLINMAYQSIGIKEGRESYKTIIKYYLQQIDLINEQKKQVEKQIENILESIPQGKLLLSVKGLGRISAAAILSEVIDFNSFRTIREINKYTGYNLYEISSGKHFGKRRIAKRGRALLRKTLFFASLNMIKEGGIFHEQYQRHIEKGMPKMKALVAISRKLLRIIFAMFRDNREFEIQKIETIKTAA